MALVAIDTQACHGVEIGPLDKPLVTPDMGSIVYVDHELTPALREKYAHDPAVVGGDIVDVHFRWGEASLAEAIGAHGQFDYVVASHTLEHVPDVVTWFQEIAEVLRSGGILSLVIPDKRFTFDYLRAPSTPSEMVEAHLQRLRRPTFRQVFDSLASAVTVDVVEAWAGKLEPKELVRVHTEDFAFEHAHGTAADYIDAHCWVFTPQSFFDAVRFLIRRDLFDYRIASFFPTARNDLQFFVALEKIPPDLDPARRRLVQEGSIPFPERAVLGPERGGPPGEIIDAANAPALGAAEVEIAVLQERIEELLASRSWRVTAPVRWISSRFHRG